MLFFCGPFHLQNILVLKKFHFDFISLIESNFKKKPSEVYVSKGIQFEVSHSEKQKEIFHDYYNIYGDNKNGLAYILATATALTNKKLYSKASYSN